MKNKIYFALFSLISFLAFQVAAYAETIEGRVASTNPYELGVVVYDAQGRPYPNQLNLRIDAMTRFQGVSGIMDLRRNDPVGVDVRQDESGAWHALAVQKFTDVSVQPATPRPSPSLRDALGNPVVRGALVGAATGAIASSASGGKAGKGALVGAGVGAAAGLLGEIFGKSSSGDDS